MTAGHGEKRSRREDAVLAALLACSTIADAAKQAGIADSTLRGWLAEDDFQRRLDQLRGEAFRAELERTTAGSREYRADTLEKLRADALEKAKTKLLGEIGVQEARRRALAQPAR